MRRQFSNPAETIAQTVKPASDIAAEKFAKLPLAEQAAACPKAVAEQIDGAVGDIKIEDKRLLAAADSDETGAIASIAEAEEKALKEAKTDDDKIKVKTKAEDERKKTKEKRMRSARHFARKSKASSRMRKRSPQRLKRHMHGGSMELMGATRR